MKKQITSDPSILAVCCVFNVERIAFTENIRSQIFRSWLFSVALISYIFFANLSIVSAESIDVSDKAIHFFKPGKGFLTLLNPEGSYLATRVVKNDRQYIYVMDTSKQQRFEVFNTQMVGGIDSYITRVLWIDNNSLLVAVTVEAKGISQLNDTKLKVNVYVIDLPEKLEASKPTVRVLRTKGQIINGLPDIENKILVAKNSRHSHVYKIDTSKLTILGKRLRKTDLVDGGQFTSRNRVATVKGYAYRWLGDKRGQVLAVIWIDKDKKLHMQRRANNNEEWEVLKEWDFSDLDAEKRSEQKKGCTDTERGKSEQKEPTVYYPIGFSPKADVYLTMSNEYKDKVTIYSHNYSTGETETFFESPAGDILDWQLNYSEDRLLSVGYFDKGEVKYHYFSNQISDVQEKAMSQYPGSNVYVASVDNANNKFVLFLRSAQNPGSIVLYDKSLVEFTVIENVAPWLRTEDLSPVEVGKVYSDDLEIEYFLTLPKSANSTPLIVLPHGGPIGVGDSRYFDPLVQYLVSNGFAVLQVNFRGSLGYGKRFLAAGKAAWGDEILQDIENAVATIEKDKRINSDRRCAFGHSYGGYAAIILAIRQPNLYRCVASMGGVSDISLLYQSRGSSYKEVLDFLFENIGNPETDYEYMKSISPVFNLEKLKAPLFLAHGLKDDRVDIEHALRLKYRMDQLGKPLKWRLFEEEGHSFENYEVASAYYEELLQFIKENIYSR